MAYKDIKRIQRLALQIDKAAAILETPLSSSKKLVERLKERFDYSITLSSFTKKRRAHDEKRLKYVYSNREDIFVELAGYLNTMMEELGYYWDIDEQEYLKKKVQPIVNVPDSRILELCGLWKGYVERSPTLPAKRSNLKSRFKEYTVFKVKIYPDYTVTSETTTNKFSGTIYTLGFNSRFVITLKSTQGAREQYYCGLIGAHESLNTIQFLSLAFLDTGTEYNRAGLAIIKRESEDFQAHIINQDEWPPEDKFVLQEINGETRRPNSLLALKGGNNAKFRDS